MGFVSDTLGTDALGAVFDPGDLLGRGSAAAAEDAAALQAQAGRDAILAQQEAAARGQEFLSPFAGIGQQGIDQADFLTNPQAQFDFLQSNPLFQLGLDNANEVTNKMAASRGRGSAGDTLQQLSNNALLQAQPLIQQQKQSIGNLLNVGTGIAGSQANIEQGLGANVSGLLTDIGAANAGGLVGSANARAQGINNLASIGSTIFAASDARLKKNKKIIGQHNGHTIWSWDWNDLAGEMLQLFGSSMGVMAQSVRLTHPKAVIKGPHGFYHVNYGAL